MSKEPSKPRLLLIESSSTMRFVLEKYVREQGFEAHSLESFREAGAALREQFESFDGEYACVLFGWPPARDAEAAKFVGLLESADFHDLPVVVLSQDMRADSRAWVAGRNQTVLLRWKDYRSVTARLDNLLDDGLDSEAESVAVKFSNDDIRILVVDDSASIRFALRDLLQLQGYSVTVVSSHDEAMTEARTQSFDIAVLDYYLQDSTGDDLCRALLDDPETGEMTCAILTGTYSDHIIKSSLRAGAIECMFKNESSELLLARIDAISRLVRQRKSLVSEHRKMDSVIDSIGGSVLVFDLHGSIVFTNEGARRSLGYSDNHSLVGESVAESISGQLYESEKGERLRGAFLNRDGEPINVVYKSSELNIKGKTDGTIVVFRTVEEVLAEQGAVAPNDGDASTEFVAHLRDSLALRDQQDMDQSLLIFEIVYRNERNELSSLTDVPQSRRQLTRALRKLYPQSEHLAYIGGSRYAVLLQHTDDKQALMQTRKLMQIANELAADLGLAQVSGIGCLASAARHSKLDATQLMLVVEKGMKIAGDNGRNSVYLLDFQRHLSVYPASADSGMGG